MIDSTKCYEVEAGSRNISTKEIIYRSDLDTSVFELAIESQVNW